MTTPEGLNWFKSSRSENGGACVEVAADLVISRGVVPLRDSKWATGPVLAVTSSAFAGFVAGIKSGDLTI
ncbi:MULTISPECIES: DUF397 domain-containing protein [Streptomyces]|uniref:DUF397 domain-containing protein n=1 Tax=Streptomyces evansiae TaxID=3075535 RepID=A0ABD5E594_9ACTN|nr:MULTISPECIES: DUF397 domain-containing protein [unclassified Streptomyces]ASY32913.1 DUF397 domain-containing protein [Streptomyces sp. CLI2509]MDT0416590.1 DUF397 domain-containing protein [Streptomyces sp. DSM 41982]MYX21075.1 DUF397 domain-containing protein [Streptomyces sp. SID8380]SCE19303.1 protein of unknown function [Streptomyces sp. SolWspMP-sol7th]